MSRVLHPFEFSLQQGEAELAELGVLLAGAGELSESADLLPFFNQRRHLVSLAGLLNPQVQDVDRMAPEFDLFGNFRCDWVVGDSTRRAFTLVEMEDARPSSIFAPSGRTYADWGRRFEHGFSQLVDWFWTIDCHNGNPDFELRFGGRNPSFTGVLVIGRNAHLQPEHAERLRWRLDHVVIDSNKIICLTYDQLHAFLTARIRSARRLAGPHHQSSDATSR